MLRRLAHLPVRLLAGAAALLVLVAFAAPSAVYAAPPSQWPYSANPGPGLTLTDLTVDNTQSPTQYTVNVTNIGGDQGNKVALFFGPENPPNNPYDAYQPERVPSQTCTQTSQTTWSCSFTIDWQDAANWHGSTSEFTTDKHGAIYTVNDWYTTNNYQPIEIFAALTDSPSNGWSHMSGYLSQPEPENNLPEVPYAVALPAVLVIGIGASLLVRRRVLQRR